MSKEITITNLTKRFNSGRIVAVDNLQLQIPSGSFTSILGPSGCGKTTLLRCIAGLEQADEGSIQFGSEEVTHQTPQERNISMVFQDVTLYPHMTCRENIEYALKVKGIPKSERDDRVEETAELLQIPKQLDKSPAGLSGGQQQRVGLAAAIVNRSDVILLDEPMSDLDAKLKAELRFELQRLHQKLDSTMVYVTHNQTEAMSMADNVVVLRDGTVEQAQSPTEVFNSPNSKYVAKFIGQPEMNILPVDIVPSIEKDQVSDIGIRPSDLSINPNEDDIKFEVEIKVIEPLGTNFVVHSEYEDHGITIMIHEESPPSVGDTITVGASPNLLHLFSAEGSRIAADHDSRSEKEGIHEH